MTTGGRLSGYVGLIAGLAAAHLATGCGVLNPSLFPAVGANPVRALDTPEGSIVILVMNRTSSIVAARVIVTKQNGGEVQLTIPAGPFGSGTIPDHAAVVQDCDVEQIEVVSITTEGDIEIPSFSPPLRNGLELSCGKVVAILLVAVGAEPLIMVY